MRRWLIPVTVMIGSMIVTAPAEASLEEAWRPPGRNASTRATAVHCEPGVIIIRGRGTPGASLTVWVRRHGSDAWREITTGKVDRHGGWRIVAPRHAGESFVVRSLGATVSWVAVGTCHD